MRTQLIACIIATLAVAGCKSAHMPLPEALTNVERLPVEGRQGWKIKQSVRFGAFQVPSIDRSWVRGPDLVVNQLELNRRRQTYSFELHETTDVPLRAACNAALRRGSVEAVVGEVEFANRATLDCTIETTDDETDSWTLALTGEFDRPLEGTLKGEGSSWSVIGTKKLAGGLPAESTTGYEIRHAGHPVGGVEVVGNGAVWLPSGAGRDKQLLAAAAAALLILEDLRAYLPGEV